MNLHHLAEILAKRYILTHLVFLPVGTKSFDQLILRAYQILCQAVLSSFRPALSPTSSYLSASTMSNDDELAFNFQDDQDSPSKRRKPSETAVALKDTHDGKERVYCEVVQGGFELYYIQKTVGTDGFFNELREDVKQQGQFSKTYGLISVANRRISKTSTETLHNPSSPKKASIPRQVIIRMVQTSSKQSRKACAEQIAKFLNEKYWMMQPATSVGSYVFDQWAKESKNKIPRYILASDFDRTLPHPHTNKLSHIIVDQAVVEIVSHSYNGTGPKWAEQNPKLASMFFDPPYPDVAKSDLGYVNPIFYIPTMPATPSTATPSTPSKSNESG